MGYRELRRIKVKFEIDTAHSVRGAIALALGVSAAIVTIASLTKNSFIIVRTTLIVGATAITAIREPKRAKQNQKKIVQTRQEIQLPNWNTQAKETIAG